MVKKIFENNMKLEMDSVSENESLARMGVASFLTKIDPTLEEINDIKTAVSEAVTNSIIHGYRDKKGIVEIKCHLRETIIEKEDNLEIVKLRKELNQLIEYETERSMQSVSYYSTPKIDLETKLASSKQILKAEGIEITSLEIQFLDGKEDILDTLYHQDISLTF